MLRLKPPKSMRSAQMSTAKLSRGLTPKASSSSLTTASQMPSSITTVGSRGFFFLAFSPAACHWARADLRHIQPARATMAPTAARMILVVMLPFLDLRRMAVSSPTAPQINAAAMAIPQAASPSGSTAAHSSSPAMGQKNCTTKAQTFSRSLPRLRTPRISSQHCPAPKTSPSRAAHTMFKASTPLIRRWRTAAGGTAPGGAGDSRALQSFPLRPWPEKDYHFSIIIGGPISLVKLPRFIWHVW